MCGISSSLYGTFMKVKKKISPSDKAQRVESTPFVEKTVTSCQWLNGQKKVFLPVGGAAHARLTVQGAEHRVLQALICPFVLEPSSSGRNLHNHTVRPNPWQPSFLFVFSLFLWGGSGRIISLGHSPHLSYPHRSEGREYFLASES